MRLASHAPSKQPKSIKHTLRVVSDNVPSSAKRDIADELRDHLLEAQSNFMRQGMDELTAERKAVSQFGDPLPVAAQLARIAAQHHARRLVRLLFVAVALLAVMWTMVSTHGPAEPWPETGEPTAVSLADGAAAIALLVSVSLAAAAGILAAPVWMRRADRFRSARTRIVRACVPAAAGALLIGLLGVAGYIGVRASISPTSLRWTYVIPALLVSLGFTGAIASRLLAFVQNARAFA